MTVGRLVTQTDALVQDADGLFGPDSVAWRLHASPLTLLGGMRALLIQALHPRAVAGVVQHSVVGEDTWGRFQRTSDYLLTVVYGNRTDAEAPPLTCDGFTAGSRASTR